MQYAVVGRRKDPAALRSMLEAVEAGKQGLSSQDATGIDIPSWDGQLSLIHI